MHFVGGKSMANPSDIARWMREEHDKVHDVLASLRERVASIPRANVGPWLKALRNEYEHFRAHLEKHFALEEEGGHLASVLQIHPALNDEVDRLIAEHREFTRLMTAIFDEVAGLQSDLPLYIRDTCARIQNLIVILEQHENHENMLVSHVFTRDMGSND
jgi:hemerythrin-like domain-containing protein